MALLTRFTMTCVTLTRSNSNQEGTSEPNSARNFTSFFWALCWAVLRTISMTLRIEWYPQHSSAFPDSSFDMSKVFVTISASIDDPSTSSSTTSSLHVLELFNTDAFVTMLSRSYDRYLVTKLRIS
jgi:hypothetical protein